MSESECERESLRERERERERGRERGREVGEREIRIREMLEKGGASESWEMGGRKIERKKKGARNIYVYQTIVQISS